MMQQTGVRSGILLAILGIWVLLRTVNQDSSRRTLIDHILGKASSLTPGQAAVGVTPGQAAVTQAQAIQSAANAIQSQSGIQLQAPALDPSVIAGGRNPPTATRPAPITGSSARLSARTRLQALLNRAAQAGQGIR